MDIDEKPAVPVTKASTDTEMSTADSSVEEVPFTKKHTPGVEPLEADLSEAVTELESESDAVTEGRVRNADKWRKSANMIWYYPI
jgi:hypothetical protein